MKHLYLQTTAVQNAYGCRKSSSKISNDDIWLLLNKKLLQAGNGVKTTYFSILQIYVQVLADLVLLKYGSNICCVDAGNAALREETVRNARCIVSGVSVTDVHTEVLEKCIDWRELVGTETWLLNYEARYKFIRTSSSTGLQLNVLMIKKAVSLICALIFRPCGGR